MGIFEPYRAIGYISTGAPFSIQRLGTKTFFTVSVGKSFQVCSCTKVSLVLVATWSRHNAKVNLLMLIGDYILSADVDGNAFTWAFKGIEQSGTPVGHIMLDNNFAPSCIIHPDTYLNKLWNISTKKKLYEFNGWNSSITSCVLSPALDVVVVGCVDEKFHVHNIRYNEEVIAFSHSTREVISLWATTFSIWMFLWHHKQEAHDSSIVSLHFFANVPVLISTSADNSIKMWIFNTGDGGPRLLRFRSGHSAPLLCIRFYANERHILSVGQDRAFCLFYLSCICRCFLFFNAFSPYILNREHQSRELSQRHVSKRVKKQKMKLKLKPVIAFDCASYLDMSERSSCAHDEEVVGVACDATNTLMISSGYHGDVKVWDFKGSEIKSRWEVNCSLVKIVYHRPNGLLATVVNDLVIRVFDVVALRMVCKFKGHTDHITDLCFSEDARQLYAIHVDMTITSLPLSPNMDVLATTHVDQLGAKTTKALMEELTEYYEKPSAVNKVHLMRRLFNLKMAEGTSVDHHINELNKVLNQLSTVNIDLDDEIQALILLSSLPESWSATVTSVCNKPIQTPKKPERAPFFLPSIPSLSGEILFKPSEPVKDEKDDKAEEAENNKKKSSTKINNFSAFTDYLKGLSPSTLDMELRMLQIREEDDLQEVKKRPEFASIELLVYYFIHEISSRNNFEFVAGKLSDTQCGVWERIDEMFQIARCMLTFLSNSQF
ncbi:hypothetical protein K2173_027348 [Erythroxylum novogranatense]|uniref:WDR36/Utp21 N-terminal domain-containing protein n=1 Tax=Erythroxylum novogranatense TaxID=1862640 RepID=A0AAV8U063_9ROSI|nr:hypothetical protein K2173_027348 [Erythroxylum novogranatense]